MGDEFFERRVGTELHGKWTLEKLLGVGGMAAVYLGRHRIGRRDAIKILHPSAARSDETRARFEQEARAVARLGHPGTVRIDDIDTAEDGSIYLVMEVLEGESLADRLERGGGTIDDALRWADEILDVLAAAHAIGIVHRDVKPDNVFLTTDGKVKLLDFGIARMRDPGSIKTATGVALGTLPFMAPEQVRGEPIDPRVDLFALGATLVRTIGRRKIHEASSDADLMMRMGTQAAPPASSLLASAPESLWPLIDRALAFDRELRYPDAATMQRDVRALREGGHATWALAAAPLPAAVTIGAAGAPSASAAMSAVTVVPGEASPVVTFAATVARPPQTGISPRVLATLAGAVATGVALTVILILALRGDDAPDAASLSPSDVAPLGSTEPGAAPISGLEVTPTGRRPLAARPIERPAKPPGATPPGSPPPGSPPATSPPATSPPATSPPPANPPPGSPPATSPPATSPPAPGKPPPPPPQPGKKKKDKGDDDDDRRGHGRDDKKKGGKRDRD